MQDFSSFIHEEIFLINPTSKSDKVAHDTNSEIDESTNDRSNYVLGIVAPEANEEDKKLLDKILIAISIEPKSIFFNNVLDSQITTWLIFSDSLDFIEIGLQHFTISHVGESIIITSKPLKKLRESIEDKGRLWSLLKDHFKS